MRARLEQTVAPVPTLEDAQAFVADYEAARGRAFDAAERRLCAGAFGYSCAYTARCAHALAPTTAPEEGSFGALIAREGRRLLAW